MEQKCPKAFIVPDKEKTQKRVTLSEVCTLLRVGENGGTKDRTTDMARKLNVTRTTFKELIEKIWGEQRMPNLSLVKNIQDGSAGFSDERLNEFGWAAAKASGVSLLAFFVALSPEKRKVLEDENKKQRWSLNVKTGEMELVSIKTAHGRQQVNSENPKTGVTEEVSRTTAYWRQQVDWEDPETGVTKVVPRSTARGRQRVDWENPETGVTEVVPRTTARGRQRVDWEDPVTGVTEEVPRSTAYKRQRVDWEDPETGVTEEVPRSTARGRQRVDWEDPKTGVTEEVPRTTARGRQLVDWEDPVTGVTEEVPRSTAYKRQRVDWEDPVTGVTEEVPRSTAYMRQLVPFQEYYIRRSSKQSILNREKKCKRCPCGDKCPSCDIQTSELWITLRKATEYFVQTGDECGFELKDEDVVDYWCKIAPKLSETMFQANGANKRVVCKYCFRFAIRRFAEEFGQTTIFVPQ